MKNVRATAVAVIASGVFGGAVGALATAATQSVASPQAIAAAVQQVSDTTAEHKLGVIQDAIEQICLYTPKTYKHYCSH